jgi:hypothetical protein
LAVKRWVVVLELAVGDGVAYLDLDEIERLVQEAARGGLEVVYAPDRHGVQLVIDAATAAQALQAGVSRWHEAAREGPAAALAVKRVEVTGLSG